MIVCTLSRTDDTPKIHDRPLGSLSALEGARMRAGYLQEARAENAVTALARMAAVTSSVVREGKLLRVPSADLVCGDLLLLEEGDAVGADAPLVQAASLRWKPR